MTTTDDTARLKATNERLREKIDVLEMDYEDLQGELAQAVHLDPYAMPAKVVRVLINQLTGWPATDWRELAALIEAHVVRSTPIPPRRLVTSDQSSTTERRAAPP